MKIKGPFMKVMLLNEAVKQENPLRCTTQEKRA